MERRGLLSSPSSHRELSASLRRIQLHGETMRKSLSCPLLLVFLFFCTIPCLTTAQDTIAAGQSLNNTQTLASPEGRFELLFFSPGRSRLWYLGIRYKSIPEKTVVWVANRRRPVPDSTGVLELYENGSLVLTDATSTVYWSAGTVGGGGVRPVARLLNDGNFVLLDAAARVNGVAYAWQSFHHPADTMLPGMMIGVDLRTWVSRNVTAWKSGDDPSPGHYYFNIVPRGYPQLVVANGTATMWRAGPWVGERFIGIPSMKANNLFSYGFIWNDGEVYFKFDVWNKSLLSRIVANQSGVVQHFVWEENGGYWGLNWETPAGICERVGVCGPNSICDASKPPTCRCLDGFQPKQQQEWEQGIAAGGCVQEVPLHCRNGTGEFKTVKGAKLPDTSGATANRSLGADDCRAACLRNCSCTAFSSSDGSGCITWFGDLDDLTLYAGGGQDLYVRAAAVAGQGSGHKWHRVAAIIIITVAIVPAMLLLMWMGFRRCRRRVRRRNFVVRQDFNENYHNDESARGNDFELPIFHLSIIVAATDNFSPENKLGEGGYGPVYKGKLQDGQLVAAKRMSASSGQGSEEFKSEVGLVAKLQHTNLVRLLGCCIEAEERILVYEYMPNQSLDKFIFDSTKGAQLDWPRRFNIIEGIAQGLLYLHKYSRLRIIHRDLKASNILLDGDWNPKISDFGMARMVTNNDAQTNTRRIVGTYGYIAPEYAMKGLFSIKSDVFSFGILLLEIIYGKRNTSTHYFGVSLNLSGYIWKLWNEGRALEILDPKLANTCSSAIGILRCIHVAMLCVQENPVDRPTMLDVVSMLNNEIVGLPAVNRPAYYFDRNITSEDVHEIEGSSSTNDVTFSELQPR